MDIQTESLKIIKGIRIKNSVMKKLKIKGSRRKRAIKYLKNRNRSRNLINLYQVKKSWQKLTCKESYYQQSRVIPVAKTFLKVQAQLKTRKLYGKLEKNCTHQTISIGSSKSSSLV